jgi:hypothetical protein
MNHSVNQQPTASSAVAPYGFIGKLTRALTWAVLMAKLVEARDRCVGGLLVYGQQAVDWVSRKIARQTERLAAAFPGWSPARPPIGFETADPIDQPLDAANTNRSSRRRKPLGWFEREDEPACAPPRRPNPSQPRQTRQAQPRRNGSGRPGEPRTATAPKAAADRPRCPRRRAPTHEPVSLVAEDLIRLGCLQPGAYRDRTLIWLNGAGGVRCAVGCEANMIDPASSWVRLRFAHTDRRTHLRTLVDQRVWLEASPDGTSWRFANERSLYGRLDMRPGDRFRFPPDPGLRPACKRPQERAHVKPFPGEKATRPKSPKPLLYLDLLFPGCLRPLEIRRGVWNFAEDLGAVTFEANTVGPDKNLFFLHFLILDEAGQRRSVSQELELVWRAGTWWFKDENARISAHLVFRAGRFRISPTYLASKPRRVAAPAPAEPCSADMPGAPPEEPVRPHGSDVPTAPIRDGDGSRPNFTPARRGDWLRSKFAVAKATAKGLAADVFEEPLRKAGVLPRVHALKGNLARIVAGTCSLVTGLTMRLMARLGLGH